MGKTKLSQEECKVVLKNCAIGYLSMSDGAQPYTLPFNFAFVENELYIHTGWKGHKLDILDQNPLVCFTATELGEKICGESPCSYTYNFDSVLVFGTVEKVTDVTERKAALNYIIQKYKEGQVTEVPEDKVGKLNILRINVTEITGRKNMS